MQPLLAHSYKSSQPDDTSNSMCFEVLGFDFLLDSEHQPWLLEVNSSPSFKTDTPLDRAVKQAVLREALTLIHVLPEQRLRYKQDQKALVQQRTWVTRFASGPRKTPAREAAAPARTCGIPA